MEYTSFNAKGKADGPVIVQKVTSVKDNNNVIEVLLTVEMEEVSVPATYYIKGGNMIEPKENSFPAELLNPQGMYADLEGQDVIYPIDITPGTELPGYTYSMMLTFDQAPGMFQMVDVVGKDRKFVAEEEITVPAGTFLCRVIEATETQTATFNGQSQSETSKTKTWFAEGVGMVKEEKYSGRGKQLGSVQLTSLTKPE